MMGLDRLSERFGRVRRGSTQTDGVSIQVGLQRASALQQRLEEALVFIIYEDGRREYRTMTLRELYNNVLSAIATRPDHPADQETPRVKLRKQPTVAHLGSTTGVVPDVLAVDKTKQTQSFVSSLDGSDRNSEHKDEPPADDDDDEEARQKKRVSFTKGTAKPGPNSPHTGANVTYRERLGGYLHPRDMRRLVTPFSSSNAPEIMVRRHVILLNCDPLRAIVLRDRLIVLVPDGADSILETLAKRIGGGREEMEDSVFGDHSIGQSAHERAASSHHEQPSKTMKRIESNLSARSDVTVEETSHSDEDIYGDEWDDLQGKEWIDMPFELQALDAVLHTVTVMLTGDVELMQQDAYETMEELLDKGRPTMGTGDTIKQKILRAMKNDIKEMSSRVDNFVRALNEALDDEEDLSLMNLSRLITHPERFVQPVPQEVLAEESDEPELILEAYLQQALSTANQLNLLKGQIVTTEELMAMQLDTVRNRLLYVNTVVSVITLTVSLYSVVGSIFGMNVVNGLEEVEFAFRNIVVGTLFACLAFLGFFLCLFYKAGTLPSVA